MATWQHYVLYKLWWNVAVLNPGLDLPIKSKEIQGRVCMLWFYFPETNYRNFNSNKRHNAWFSCRVQFVLFLQYALLLEGEENMLSFPFVNPVCTFGTGRSGRHTGLNALIYSVSGKVLDNWNLLFGILQKTLFLIESSASLGTSNRHEQIKNKRPYFFSKSSNQGNFYSFGFTVNKPTTLVPDIFCI